MAVLGRGFLGRIAVFLALVFGYLISWLADQWSTDPVLLGRGQVRGGGTASTGPAVQPRVLARLPQDDYQPHVRGAHRPAPAGVVDLTFILLVIPSVIALLAENSGHVKAVSGDDR